MDDVTVVALQIRQLRDEMNRRFDHLAHHLGILEKMEMDQTQQLTQLQADVANEDTVIGSAVTLINGIAARIDQAGGDPAALTALSADIKAQSAALAAAVAANTPPPAPAPAPVGSPAPAGAPVDSGAGNTGGDTGGTNAGS